MASGGSFLFTSFTFAPASCIMHANLCVCVSVFMYQSLCLSLFIFMWVCLRPHSVCQMIWQQWSRFFFFILKTFLLDNSESTFVQFVCVDLQCQCVSARSKTDKSLPPHFTYFSFKDHASKNWYGRQWLDLITSLGYCSVRYLLQRSVHRLLQLK